MFYSFYLDVKTIHLKKFNTIQTPEAKKNKTKKHELISTTTYHVLSMSKTYNLNRQPHKDLIKKTYFDTTDLLGYVSLKQFYYICSSYIQIIINLLTFCIDRILFPQTNYSK